MSEQTIENGIREALAGEEQKNALAFAAYLRAGRMLFERGQGYWEDKLYWLVKCQNEYECFILINGYEAGQWVVWTDDSDSNCFEDFPLDEHMKEIAWRNIDFCASCGGDCSPGRRKTIFGKAFDNVCRTAMKFTNPDVEALECMKKLVEIRTLDILT